jgi:cytochrome oxidase Cu insertion factor (SCO1/SenC/PrrC family)
MRLRPRGRRQTITVLVTALVAIGAGVGTALFHPKGFRHSAPVSLSESTTGTIGGPFAGAEVSPVPAPGFSLRDQDGRRATLAGYRGQVVVMAFVGTGCAPGCVLVAQQIRGALDDVAHAPAVLLVSVSPATDTPARVRAFLRTVSLAGRARYLAAPAAALASVWRAYRVTTPSAGSGAFQRAILVVLVDRQGRERVLYQPEQLTPEALAHDIGKLQNG